MIHFQEKLSPKLSLNKLSRRKCVKQWINSMSERNGLLPSDAVKKTRYFCTKRNSCCFQTVLYISALFLHLNCYLQFYWRFFFDFLPLMLFYVTKWFTISTNSIPLLCWFDCIGKHVFAPSPLWNEFVVSWIFSFMAFCFT